MYDCLRLNEAIEHMTDKTAKKLSKLLLESYDRIAPLFSETRRWPLKDCTPLEHIIKNGDVVLDVGCGNGRIFDLFARRDISYIGIDASTALIQEAQKQYASEKGARFIVGDMADSEIYEELREQCGVLISCAAFHHLPLVQDRENVLSYWHSALGIGGTLFLTVWNLWRFSFKEKTVWKYAIENSLTSEDGCERRYGIDHDDLSWRDLITQWQSGNISVPLYYYAFRARDLVRFARRAGFTIQEIYYSLNGMRAHWWNGRNIVLIAKKESPMKRA